MEGYRTSAITAADNVSKPARARLHYLDWLRVLAVLGVFLFHAVHPFDEGWWHIKNADVSMAITVAGAFFTTWGMAFFFLIAGAGTWFALRKRTARSYIRERFSRLLIPYVVGTILFSPLTLFLEWNNRMQLGVTSAAAFQDYLDGIKAYYLNLGINPRWFGLGEHLWFIGFLFAFALLTLPLFLWIRQEAGQRAIERLAGWCQRRGGILAFALPLVLIQIVFRQFSPTEHDWTDFFFQMSFFVLGYLLFASDRFVQAIRRDWSICLVIGIVTMTVMTAMLISNDEFDSSAPMRTTWDFVFWSIMAVHDWCWCLVFVYVGMRFLDYSNRWSMYGMEMILPFFVLHQPIIIFIAYFVVQWNASIPVKLPVVVFSSFAATIAVYELLVRRVEPLPTLFGMKTERLKQPV